MIKLKFGIKLLKRITMMKKNNNVFLFALIALISVSAIAQDKKWSLKEAVDYALENNLQVQHDTAQRHVVIRNYCRM